MPESPLRAPAAELPADAFAPVDLRPLTTSELIDRGFSLYRSCFAGFLLLALLSQIVPLLSQVLVTAWKLTPSSTDYLSPAIMAKKCFFYLLISMGAQIVAFCFEVVLTFFASDAYLGKRPSVRACLRRFSRCLGASLWTCLLNRFLLGVTFLFPFLALVAITTYFTLNPPQGFAMLILLVFVSMLFAVLSIVPLLIVFMRLMVTVPAVALEGLSGWKAVRRSSELVRYDPGLGVLYWGEMRLSFLLLPLFVIEMLVLSLTWLPVIILQISEAVRHGASSQLVPPTDATVIISQVLAFLGGSLILPLYVIATTLFYYDVRIRREGFDLEFMARKLEEPS